MHGYGSGWMHDGSSKRGLFTRALTEYNSIRSAENSDNRSSNRRRSSAWAVSHSA
jgi:hypothetical protein